MIGDSSRQLAAPSISAHTDRRLSASMNDSIKAVSAPFEPRVRLESVSPDVVKRSIEFCGFVRTIEAFSVDRVHGAIGAIARATLVGLHAAGFIACVRSKNSALQVSTARF